MTTRLMTEWKTRYDPTMTEGTHRPEIENAYTWDQNEGARWWLETLKLMNEEKLKTIKTTRSFSRVRKFFRRQFSLEFHFKFIGTC